jgi:hypothetical protein
VRRWWCKRCNAVRFAERNATISLADCGRAKLLLSRGTLFLNDRGHRGHRVSLPDALFVSLWFRDRLLIGSVAAGWLGGSLALPGAQVVVQAV